MSKGDGEFIVNDEDEVNIIGSFQGFTEPVLDPSLLDDESDLHEATTDHPITKREYKLMNMMIDILVHGVDSFSPKKIENMMGFHKSTVKTIISLRKWLFYA